MTTTETESPVLRAIEPEPDRARVLVVDDDERNLLAIRTVLEDVADIVVARSGEEALRHLLAKDEFAVILLDVYMPVMDGYEVAQIIRGREQTKRIPIVFLSAVNKETEHLIRGYSMGAVDYVFKPVEPLVLRSKVSVFVDLFRMRREIQRKAREQEELLKANLRTTAELIRAEQELRLAEQRQAAIINSLPILLYLEPYDRNPRWPAFVSGDLPTITGFSYDQIAADPTVWEQRLHPEDRDHVLAALRERKTSGRLSIEYRWQAPDGSWKHFLDQAVLLPSDDGPGEFAGTLLDVTDRKVLETQLIQAQKMDAIGKLTGGIAHDFNNLLAAVLGGIGLIERRVDLAEDQKKILAMTRHAAEQGTELVRRLLAFARRQKLLPAAITLPDLCARLDDLLAHTLGGLVDIQWKGMDREWRAFADETQLELAIMNLAINARDAMPEGGTITIAADQRSVADGDAMALAAGDYVIFTVADTGEGIAPEVIGQVMEPFFTTKPVGKGTGLGLSMVYGFARQSGGGVQIHSEVGHGTCVTIWLPRAPEGVALDSEGRRQADIPTIRPLRIVLVDDHEGVRAVTAAMLSELGHEVSAVRDGNSVVQRLSDGEQGWDLLITDYAMPTISGSELLRKAKQHAPHVKGLLITGYADPDSIGNRPAGIEVLGKPFTIDQLKAAIGRCVS
jgi:signal transduction histidine kinase